MQASYGQNMRRLEGLREEGVRGGNGLWARGGDWEQKGTHQRGPALRVEWDLGVSKGGRNGVQEGVRSGEKAGARKAGRGPRKRVRGGQGTEGQGGVQPAEQGL